MIIKTPDNYYTESDALFETSEIALTPGLTVLVGCNGSGKSTFIKMIEASCKENNIPVFSYNALRDGRDMAKLEFLETDLHRFITSSVISEGENILNDLSPYVEKLSQFVKDNKGSESIMITMDAVDSGLSIDAMLVIKDLLHQIIKDTKNDINTYIVISVNAYEMTRNEICLYPAKNKYVVFNAYEAYKEFILKSAEKRNERYEKIKKCNKHDNNQNTQ